MCKMMQGARDDVVSVVGLRSPVSGGGANRKEGGHRLGDRRNVVFLRGILSVLTRGERATSRDSRRRWLLGFWRAWRRRRTTVTTTATKAATCTCRQNTTRCLTWTRRTRCQCAMTKTIDRSRTGPSLSFRKSANIIFRTTTCARKISTRRRRTSRRRRAARRGGPARPGGRAARSRGGTSRRRRAGRRRVRPLAAARRGRRR
mmetsp:Transcript_25769/g.102895  ORF Transcript_25769/g.102895 Transcript_25769/m.102895 type:complete len:203 (+) Transcript_25769:1262-1870(+)